MKEPTKKEIEEFLKEHNISCWNYPYCHTENCIGCEEWEAEKNIELTIKSGIKFLENHDYKIIKKQEYYTLLRDFEHAKRELAKIRIEYNRKFKDL